MGLFDKMREPVFLKESSDAQNQLERLKELELKLNNDGKQRIKQDIKMLEYGIFGEKNIAFELKNSHMPMYILHDVYLESDGLTAQIDYLVFTRKFCFIVECKNLMGDIEINASGDFIRTTEFGGKKKKEGIYSPITQNVRHMDLMKKIRLDKSANFLHKMIVGSNFDNQFKSIVVLANPKTILNAKYAKKEVKDQVLRADQLVSYIKEAYKQSKETEFSEKDFQAWAERYLSDHIEKEHDYTDKYEQYLIQETAQKAITETKAETRSTYNKPEYKKPTAQKKEWSKSTSASSTYIKPVSVIQPAVQTAIPVLQTIVEIEVKNITATSLEESLLYKELREFRLQRSREEEIKAYYIFNDNQMKDIVSQMPMTHDVLVSINGFGEAKAIKYGSDILKIVKKFR